MEDGEILVQDESGSPPVGSQLAQQGYRLDAAGLRKFVAVLPTRLGMRPEDAGVLADVLVRTDLRGVHTHGCQGIGTYLSRMKAGAIDPVAEVEVLRDTPSTALLDARNGMGHVVSWRAMRRAVEKARATGGIASVAVTNSTHFGAGGIYALLAAEAHCVGLVFTTTPVNMNVTGSRRATIGNGPIAYGFPTGSEPVVLDLAMSKTAGSVIPMAEARGLPLVEGSATDFDGRPTTDPREVAGLVPIGDHKGYGLALLSELLGGAMTGTLSGIYGPGKPRIARIADDVGGSPDFGKKPPGIGHLFIAIAGDAFQAPGALEARVSALADEIRAAPRLDGVERIYLPGELETLREQSYRATGIAFDKVTYTALENLAREYDCVELLERSVVSIDS